MGGPGSGRKKGSGGQVSIGGSIKKLPLYKPPKISKGTKTKSKKKSGLATTDSKIKDMTNHSKWLKERSR
jgi:hypothetical protein